MNIVPELIGKYFRRFLHNIRAIKAKIKLPKRAHSMVTVLIQLRRTLALKLTPHEKNEFEVLHISVKTDVSCQFKAKYHSF